MSSGHYNPHTTNDCRIAYLLGAVAGVVNLLEEDQEFTNNIGAYITIGDTHFEFNGQEFVRWSPKWELVKQQRTKKE